MRVPHGDWVWVHTRYSHRTAGQGCNKLLEAWVAGDDIRQKLEFHHVHLELGALGYIETFLFIGHGVFFKKKTHQGRFSFLKTQGSPLWI